MGFIFYGAYTYRMLTARSAPYLTLCNVSVAFCQQQRFQQRFAPEMGFCSILLRFVCTKKKEKKM